ncbi:MAG: MFS transporter [Propionibacteriaceae bacterium]|nr:MFS transporter [Propionibacteriaceae bacterium]
MKGFIVRAYREILSLPGALAFCLAGLLARAGGAMMGIGIVLMVRAIYGSYELAGVLSATEALCWAVGTAVLSNWVDRIGQRRVMLPAAIVFAVSLAALVGLAALQVPPAWLFIPCAVAGLSGGSPGALVRARWNHALADPHLLHTALSLESTLDEFTWVIGPVAAAGLATLVSPEAALLVVIVISTLGAFVFYSLRATEPPISPRSAGGAVAQTFLLRIPGVWPIVAISALIGVVFGSGDVTVVAATEAWGAQSLSGLVLGAIALGSAIAGFSYGSRRWKTPLLRRFRIGIIAMMLGVSTLIFSWSPLSLAVFGFVYGFAIAPTLINTNTLMQRIVPESRITEGLSWIGTSLGVGVAIGSSVAGWLIDNVTFKAAFAACSVAAVGAALLAIAAAPVIARSVRPSKHALESQPTDS